LARIAGLASAVGFVVLIAVLAFAPLYGSESSVASTDGIARTTVGSATLWQNSPSARGFLVGLFLVLASIGGMSLVAAWTGRRSARRLLACLLAPVTIVGFLGAATIGILILPVAALGWFAYAISRPLHGTDHPAG
jgi:hypothetical protein